MPWCSRDFGCSRLAHGLTTSPNPLYWDSRSSKGETARRLLAQHSGVVTPAAWADELFTGLADRMEALDRLAGLPLTTAVAPGIRGAAQLYRVRNRGSRVGTSEDSLERSPQS